MVADVAGTYKDMLYRRYARWVSTATADGTPEDVAKANYVRNRLRIRSGAVITGTLSPIARLRRFIFDKRKRI